VKSYPKIIDRILDAIRESKTFCVIGHIRPRRRLRGFQLGLTLALRNAGQKKPSVGMRMPFRKNTNFSTPPTVSKAKGRDEIRLCYRHRLRELRALWAGLAGHIAGTGKFSFNIDHHESNTRYGDVNWVSPREPSPAN